MDEILNTSNFLSRPPSLSLTSHLNTRVAIFNNHSLGKMMVVALAFFLSLEHMSHLKPTHEGIQAEWSWVKLSRLAK